MWPKLTIFQKENFHEIHYQNKLMGRKKQFWNPSIVPGQLNMALSTTVNRSGLKVIHALNRKVRRNDKKGNWKGRETWK